MKSLKNHQIIILRNTLSNLYLIKSEIYKNEEKIFNKNDDDMIEAAICATQTILDYPREKED